MAVRLLTTEGVAARFRTSAATVRYWRHIGIGPDGVRVGRRVLYDETECDRWWQAKVAGQLRGQPVSPQVGCRAMAQRQSVAAG